MCPETDRIIRRDSRALERRGLRAPIAVSAVVISFGVEIWSVRIDWWTHLCDSAAKLEHPTALADFGRIA
jgi:hypothetical protein